MTEGIQAWVVNDAIQIAGGELPVSWRAAAKVVVSDDQAALAREFAEAFDRQAQQHLVEPDAGPHSGAGDDSHLPQSEWPTCPTCNQPKSARCPICGESGVNFPTAYSGSVDKPGSAEINNEQLFLCPSCDECIAPQWYRLCARCGHDFGIGLEISKVEPTAIKLPVRVLIVLVVLLSLLTAVTAYFWSLFAGRRA